MWIRDTDSFKFTSSKFRIVNSGLDVIKIVRVLEFKSEILIKYYQIATNKWLIIIKINDKQLMNDEIKNNKNKW